MVNKAVILFPLPLASCGWVLQISFVQPKSKLNIRWKYILPLKLRKHSSKRASSSLRDRREEESWRSLLLSAGLCFVVPRLNKLNLRFQTGCRILCFLTLFDHVYFNPIWIICLGKKKKKRKATFILCRIIWIHCSLANNLSCFHQPQSQGWVLDEQADITANIWLVAVST